MQAHSVPQVPQGVPKLIHSFAEGALVDAYYVPDTVLFTSICYFIHSSLYPHFNNGKTGGSERLNNFFKFRNPDSGRAGF